MVGIQAHNVTTSIVEMPLAVCDAGTGMVLKVRASCSEKCCLQGGKVRIVDGHGVVVEETGLSGFDGTVNETDEFVVRAPIEPGEYRWTVMFAGQEMAGVWHEQNSAPFSLTVKAHAVSISVWDVPSQVAVGDGFSIKVGVKCSAGCSLAGHRIEIYDQQAERVVTATLSEAPWPSTIALHWVEVGLAAPGMENCYKWEARFSTADLELPHEQASRSFSLSTEPKPDYVVTIDVLDKQTQAPIKGALVALPPYRSYTDEAGVARIEVPRGSYTLRASKGIEYEALETTVRIARNLTMKVELLEVRPEGLFYAGPH